MASEIIKKYSAPYTFESVTYPDSAFTINTSNVVINGNLVVVGTATEVDVAVLDVHNNKITLNAGLLQTEPPTLDASLVVNRGNEANVSLLWNEATNSWQLTNDGVVWSDIVVQTGVTGYISAVVEDLTPQLGGNLDVNGSTITGNVVIDATNEMFVETPMQLKNFTGTPAPTTGYTTITSGTPESGDAGVYVTNATVTQAELITASKALVYALIL